MRDGKDQHQHGRQQIDGDGPGPGGYEIARIEDHRIGGGDRGIDHLCRLRQRAHICRRALQRGGALGEHFEHGGDGGRLIGARGLGRAVKFGQHNGGRKILRRPFHQ
ncbi:hypothetical protein KDD17_09075 [Sulfitobacter albidus]|uniref:Uncharacterized protein n=1 Tax=Sulfitobacter albidus TaxID=2829501 RepID=A0A975JB25_9RHOB|nr:hypothetical protein KDD17_09075 [Sulfitobacter albidus]